MGENLTTRKDNIMRKNGKSQTVYHFWLLPSDKFHQSPEQAYSAIRGSLNTAKEWAKNLFWTNHEAMSIEYKAENGRKVYRMDRGGLPSFYKPEVKG